MISRVGLLLFIGWLFAVIMLFQSAGCSSVTPC